MSFIFAGTPPSYAEEQLSFHLATLSTVPVSLSTSTTALKSSTPPPHNLQSAAHDLSSSKSIPRDKLVELLKSLAKIEGGIASYGADESNKALEDEVMSRAVTMVWKEVMEAFVQGALELEEERSWWEAVVNSRRGVMTHLVQSKSPRKLLS
jgi:nuclear-control-of-ATPase protein 2